MQAMEWVKLTVILYAICVIKCSAMSKSEIEDFANFLHQTSRLDQTLKKGTDPVDDYDEDEPVSDHAWEDSGKFEGDLILNDRQRKVIVEDVAEGLSRNGLTDVTKRWPDNEVVYYIQKEHFTSDQMQAIDDGISDIAQASCIKFRPYKKGDRDAVVIQGSRRGCFSQVGYQGGYQVLNLNARHPAGRGCFRHGTVVHELLHTLGFYHMQSSPDRDDYVDIIWPNIHQQAQNNFRKYNTFSVSDFGVGYDYDSVLHYSRGAFSINGQDTIVPKKSGAEIGQRVGLSDKDSQKLNRMYCEANSNDEEEETTQKTAVKKKTPKNKPFDGHGIGYHQGKAVAIKISPAAQTYKLLDVPLHVFDHFSKAPQAVSTSKIEEPGKHIEYGYKPRIAFDAESYSSFGNIQQNDVSTNSYESPKKEQVNFSKAPQLSTPEINESGKHTQYEYKSQIPFDVESYGRFGKKKQNDISKNLSDTPNTEKGNDGNNETDTDSEHSLEIDKNDDSTEKIGYDFRNEFDSLGKIIKTYTNPSYLPNFNIRKFNINDIFKPQRRSDESRVIFEPNLSSSSSKVTEEKLTANLGNANIAAQFIDRLYSSTDKFNSAEDKEEKSENDDAKSIEASNDGETFTMESYRTSFPRKHNLDEQIPSPEYVKPANLLNRHDYRNLYDHENVDSNENTEKKYKLFGEVVPFNEGWYKNYEQDFRPYNNNKQGTKVNGIQKNPAYDSNTKNDTPNSKQAYTLFGIPVPLTESWYNHR